MGTVVMVGFSGVRAYDTIPAGCMKQPLRGITALLLVMQMANGCGRTDGSSSPAPAAAPAAQPAAASAQRPQASSIRSTAPESGARATAAVPQSLPPPATPATSAELLETDRGPPVAPSDFRIGPLRLVESRTASTQEAADVLARFLDALVDGKVATELLVSWSRDRLSRSIAYQTAGGAAPIRYRIGELRETTDGELLANVRLYGKTGVAEGEIYLVGSDGAWSVGDIQVGFSRLLEPYQMPEEPFVPSTYEHRAAAPGTSGEGR